VIVEHTNINPNKAAHIGHVRNAVIGDTFVRLRQVDGRSASRRRTTSMTPAFRLPTSSLAFRHLERKTLAEVEQFVEAAAIRLHLLDVYSRSRRIRGQPDAVKLRQRDAARVEHGGEAAEWARLISRAIVRRHIETMLATGHEYDLFAEVRATSSPCTLGSRVRDVEESNAFVFETEGKHKRLLWVMKLEGTEDFEGMDEPDKILVPLERHGHLHGERHRVSALEVRAAGPGRSSYRQVLHIRRWPPAMGDHLARRLVRGAGVGGAEKVVNVIDVRRPICRKW